MLFDANKPWNEPAISWHQGAKTNLPHGHSTKVAFSYSVLTSWGFWRELDYPPCPLSLLLFLMDTFGFVLGSTYRALGLYNSSSASLKRTSPYLLNQLNRIQA